MVLFVFVFLFVIATTTTGLSDHWEDYEQDLALKRIHAMRLVAANPFNFEVDFPADIWSNTTVDFLKRVLPAIYTESLVDAKIEWRDYTDCVLGPSYVYDFDKFVPVPCLYEGTVLWIKINHIGHRATGDKSCVYCPKHNVFRTEPCCKI